MGAPPPQLYAPPMIPGGAYYPPPPAAAGYNYPASHHGGPPRRRDDSVRGPPGANLFVMGFPDSTTDQHLSQLFSPYGRVLSASVFVDKETGRPKGFGFVSFDSPQCAAAAINALNGYDLGGRRLRVDLKRDG